MASNPIQRRARQSFLVGFLIALIIMAIVVVILFMRISNLNEENASLQTLQSTNTKTIYTLVDDVKSGETITLDMLVSTSVLAQINVDNYLSSADFFDEEGNEREWVAKTDLTGGSPILRDTASVSDDVLTDDERLMEFNMIVLPSELQNGDYIDVRFSLPDGSNDIVLSKKYVEQTTATGVWMKLSEDEILMINSAIVEAYQITGSRLYAVQYTEPGLQDAAIETFYPGYDILTLIDNDANVVEEAKTELFNKLNNSNYEAQENAKNTYKADMDNDELSSNVESGNEQENELISTARDEFVSALDGTGLVGSENY